MSMPHQCHGMGDAIYRVHLEYVGIAARSQSALQACPALGWKYVSVHPYAGPGLVQVIHAVH